MATLRWLLPALLPIACFAVLVARTDPKREPRALVLTTFVLGGITAAIALWITARVEAWTGLDASVEDVGTRSALVFVFCVIAPVQETAKVAAAWPAFVSKHIDQPYDGVVHAAAAALAYSSLEIGTVLRANPSGGLWVARALLALPAHVFFACLWGYALGRAKHSRRGPPIFPVAFLASIVAHGLYAHFVYGRGPGALLAVTPLLAAMGVVAWLLARDLWARMANPSRFPSVPSRRGRPPPSLASVRQALRTDEDPVRVGWILFGTAVTLGAMVAGIAAGVFAAHAMHIDLATVDEHDLAASSPALLLGIGLLLSFPVSGWLITRAGSMHTLLEPALANVLALLITTIVLSFAAPFAVVFALAIAPIAWVLAFVGAWIAREA